MAGASDHVQRLNDDKSLLDQSGNINQDYNQAPVARSRHFSYQKVALFLAFNKYFVLAENVGLRV